MSAGTVRRYCWDSGPEHHHHAIPHEDSTICFVAASDYDALHAQAVALARAAQPVWSKTKPTELREYLYRDRNGHVAAVRLFDKGDLIAAWIADSLAIHALPVAHMDGEWAPLPLPKEATCQT